MVGSLEERVGGNPTWPVVAATKTTNRSSGSCSILYESMARTAGRKLRRFASLAMRSATSFTVNVNIVSFKWLYRDDLHMY